MHKHNIFDGESYYAMFARLIYKHFISRKWVTYTDIMVDHLGLKSAQELTCNLSNCDYYGELRKAFRGIRKAINEKLGTDSFEEEGNNRNKRFRYIGTEKDPLADMLNAKVISDLRFYWHFCQESAGFFPSSWLEYFFKDCKDLIDIKQKQQKGQQVLSSSLDRILTNIDLLPFLYVSIITKQVLFIKYKPYEEEIQELTFHPHYLKEYNGRWHLFGHAEGLFPEYGYNIALDRIIEKPREIYNCQYIDAPTNFYNNFFHDIIGVSHYPNEHPQEIHIKSHSKKIHMLIETKKLHHSQKTISEFNTHIDGEYGEFSLFVKPNNELFGRILQMGAGLEIISPQDIRTRIKSIISSMNDIYK